jgi:predicted CopG family antitoxin
MAIREPELEIAARIGITPEAYKVLRKLKAERKQSMVKIVSDLILEDGEKYTRKDMSQLR